MGTEEKAQRCAIETTGLISCWEINLKKDSSNVSLTDSGESLKCSRLHAGDPCNTQHSVSGLPGLLNKIIYFIKGNMNGRYLELREIQDKG